MLSGSSNSVGKCHKVVHQAIPVLFFDHSQVKKSTANTHHTGPGFEKGIYIFMVDAAGGHQWYIVQRPPDVFDKLQSQRSRRKYFDHGSARRPCFEYFCGGKGTRYDRHAQLITIMNNRFIQHRRNNEFSPCLQCIG